MKVLVGVCLWIVFRALFCILRGWKKGDGDGSDRRTDFHRFHDDDPGRARARARARPHRSTAERQNVATLDPLEFRGVR